MLANNSKKSTLNIYSDMSNSGWIKISRELTEMSDYFGVKFDRIRCWLDLLLLAEWREQRTFYKRGIAVTLKRGQLAVSVADLCRRWQLSHPTVEARLKEFEHAERITIKRSRLINIITIVNYAQYQDLPTDLPTQSAQNKVITNADTKKSCEQNCEQVCEQNCELPKEIKEIQECKDKKNERVFSQLEQMFEDFRKAYPGRKRGHDTEFDAFKRKHKNWSEIVPLLMPALQRLIEYKKAAEAAGQWVASFANLSTWLYQARWEEELPEVKAQGTQKAETPKMNATAADYEEDDDAFTSKNI